MQSDEQVVDASHDAVSCVVTGNNEEGSGGADAIVEIASTSTDNPPRPKKRKAVNNDDKENDAAADNILKTAVDFLNKHTTMDEWSSFGEFVASSLRQIQSDAIRQEASQSIMNTLFQSKAQDKNTTTIYVQNIDMENIDVQNL